MRGLRVGIDAWGLSGWARFTGMGQYASALLRGLPAVEGVEVVAYGAPAEPRPEWLPASVEWNPLGSRRAGKLAAIHSRAVAMPRVVAADALDVLHAPAVHARASFPPVPRVECPVLVTMHDAIPVTYYSGRLPARTRAFYGWNLRRVRAATRVLTVSQAARREIASACALRESDIDVVASAVEFAPNPDRSAVEALEVPDDFILYAGSYEPRKNLVGTLFAYDRFVAVGGNLSLVAVTEATSGHAAAVHEVLDGLAARHRVTVLHDVPDASLRALYTAARAVVFPSFAEGLGLPPIQAAICGVPVVVSNLEVFAETVGAIAVVADPCDPVSICAAIERAANDPAVRARARAAAPGVAARFGLGACIADHVACYRAAAESRHARV